MASKSRGDAPSRRDLLARSGLALGAAALAPAALAQDSDQVTDPDFADGEPHVPPPPPATAAPAPGTVDWTWVRNQWALDWGEVDLSAMLFASNPKLVREAIDRHRRALDANPVRYLEKNNRPLQNAARAAAGAYFGVPAQNIALCESTTSGIGLLYNGLGLRYGQEVLTTTHDYYVTHESLRLAALRGGGTVRKISLFDRVETVTVEQIVGRIVANIGPRTRVLALTWVHSSTGLKMPIRAIADALIPINASRAPHEKVLFCVDGAHGFGVEDTSLPQLGCDFLVAGCHKWLFGPRGTGVIFGTPLGWSRVEPTVPSFLAEGAYSAWLGGYDPGPATGARMTPGGFKAFEHVWALSEAFGFHQQVGKTNIRNRTVELAGRLKEGMVQMPHIRLRTPRDPRLSAGIVAFDVDGLSSDGVSRRLRNYRIIGSVSPYAERHVRLTPSFRNTVEDVEYALNALHVIRAGSPARPRS
jgi:isopenicillin-N epimerase